MDGPQHTVVSKETLRALYPDHPEAAEPQPLPPEDRKVAEVLAQFNRRGRLAFWSARRHGKPEQEALAAARRTLRP